MASFSRSLDEALHRAIAIATDELLVVGGWSVPSIVVDGELFFGQDRLELIDWRLDGGGSKS